MPSESPYPHLERYLKAIRTSDRFRSLKKPSSWLRWAETAACVVIAFVYGPWATILFIFALTAVHLAINLGRHRKHDGKTEVFKPDPEILPRYMLDLLRKGRLEARIGPDACARLDTAAEKAFRAGVVAFDLYTSRPDLPDLYRQTFKDVPKTVDAVFREGLRVIGNPVTFGVAPNSDVLAALADVEERLSRIAGETEALAKAVDSTPSRVDDQPLLERLRALREIEDDLHAQRQSDDP